MEIDMSQFHQVFFEESLEGLDDMEQALLGLDLNDIDAESINTIFRAAHSVKGGSATFGFNEIAEFTHILETLLDEMRAGDREVTQEAVDLFFKSVDCMRHMLQARQNETQCDPAEAEALSIQFHHMLEGEPLEDSLATEPAATFSSEGNSEPSGEGVWKIEFIPEAHILLTGNEPVRIFRELESLGEFSSVASIDKVPEFGSLDVENCFISWQLTLKADTTRATIEEVFEWIIDDCELNIQAPGEGQPQAQQTNVNDAEPVTQEVITEQNQQSQQPAEQIKAPASAAPASPPAVKPAEKMKPVKAKASTSIRVEIDKVDSLINLVGELVITQSMLSELGTDFDMKKVERLQGGLEQLLQNTKELQESVMQIRMLPISNAFNRFPRMVRDMAQQLGKNIDLKVTGEQTELDKTVMEQIGDPLVHLVRNSLDHGLEMPQERLDNGKSATGIVFLNAFHQGGNIIIEVGDDGAGLNIERIREKAIQNGVIKENDHLTESQVHDLLFEPGFSTAEVVSDISGRGVGMDVVRRNINSLGGTIEVDSVEGEGSTFRIRLPLTLAILDGQLVRVGEETYIIPLISIIESLQVDSEQINHVSGNVELYRLRDENIPIIRTYNEFGILDANKDLENALLVVVEGEGHKAALLVDDLLAQQQVVIKSLETNYKRVDGISGATILGDGTVALIVDVAGLIKTTNRNASRRRIHAA